MANLIGALVLGSIGIFVLCQPLLNKSAEGLEKERSMIGILRNPENADFDGSKTICFSEALVLGVALSINNIAGGFDAGVTNLNLWWTAIISGAFSFICISAFSYIGKKIFCRILRKMGDNHCWDFIDFNRN